MNEKRDKLFTIKVDDEEKVKWQCKARSYDISLAELIRNRLNDLPTPKKKRTKQIIEVDPRLLFEINAIGNNINQIGRRVNQGDQFDVIMELRSIESQLERLLNAHKIS